MRIFYNLIKADVKTVYNEFKGDLVLSFDTSSNVRNLDTRHTAGVDQSQDTDQRYDHQENHSPRELIIILLCNLIKIIYSRTR